MSNEVNEAFFLDKKKKIYNILMHAMTKVPYYRENISVSLPSLEEFDYSFFKTFIPLLEKKVLSQNGNQFVSDGLDVSQLQVDVTSGTEGRPLICYKSSLGKIEHARKLWRARNNNIPDLKVTDRFARFYAFRSDAENVFASKPYFYQGNDLFLSLLDLSTERLEVYWEQLLAFKPRWIHGPSSTLYNLALHLKNNNKERIPIEFIELNGEYVPEEHVQLIKEVFKCTVGNHYGSREFWSIAYSCRNGHLHVLDDSVFVETVFNEELKKNELVVTTLINKAWPLIRYKIGDIGELYIAETCDGFSKYCLDIKRGRKADFIQLDNKQVVNAITFSALSRGISKMLGYNAILQYQVIKHSGSKLEILLRLAHQNTDELIGRYDRELRKIISSEIEIVYTPVAFIKPDARTGKSRDFIDLTK